MAHTIVHREPGPISMVSLNMTEPEARALLEFIDDYMNHSMADGTVTKALRYALDKAAVEELL